MGIGRETNKKTHATKAVRSGQDEYEQDLAEVREEQEKLLADLYGDMDDEQQEGGQGFLDSKHEGSWYDDEDGDNGYFDSVYEFNGLPVPKKLSEPVSLGELLRTRKTSEED